MSPAILPKSTTTRQSSRRPLTTPWGEEGVRVPLC
jgi:hypothetical protein